MKNLKKATAMILATAMLFSMVFSLPAVGAAAKAKKPTLNPKKIILKVGQSKKVSLKNAAKAKKTKWSAKPSKAVKLAKKAKKSVTVKAMRTAKKVTLTAKFKLGKKSKKATCTIVVNAKSPRPTKKPTTKPSNRPPVTNPPVVNTSGPTDNIDPTPGGGETPGPTDAPGSTDGPAQTDGPLIFEEHFEDGYGTNFEQMGNPLYSNVEGGKTGKCLLISNRTSDYFGIASQLISSTYDFDTDYQFSVWVKQDTAINRQIKVTLDKGKGDSTELRYVSLATASVAPGVWTELTGTINIKEEEVSSPKFYIECPEKTTEETTYPDFCVDEFTLRGVVLPPDPTLPTPKAQIEFKYEGLDQDFVDDLIESKQPMVAFTFDDGPVGYTDTSTSRQIHDELIAHNAHATFFYIGQRIAEGANRVTEIEKAVEAGFEVGNHTYTGWNSIHNLTPQGIMEQVEKGQAELTKITGFTNFLFRAPNLDVSKNMHDYIQAPIIRCSIDPSDWSGATTQAQVESTLINATNGLTGTTFTNDGGIALMHETEEKTAAAIPAILDHYEDRGWRVVSVSDLFAARGVKLMTNTGTEVRSCPPKSN